MDDVIDNIINMKFNYDSRISEHNLLYVSYNWPQLLNQPQK